MNTHSVVEFPQGSGEVVKDGKTIARVQYYLHITRDLIRNESGGDVSGREVVFGRINVLDGERDLADGSILRLKLKDGRVWPFCAQSGNTIQGYIRCVGAGDFER